MALVSPKNRKKALAAVKKRSDDLPAKDRKRAVTLYLDRDNFEEFQRLYGRKTSQAIDELIAAVIGKADQ